MPSYTLIQCIINQLIVDASCFNGSQNVINATPSEITNFFYYYFFFYFTNLQADDNITDPFLSNIFAHHPSDAEFFAYVNFYDIQCVAVPGSRGRCCNRLFHVWMEKIRNR